METIRSTIRIRIPVEKESAALDILSSITEQVQYEPSCISCQIYRSVNEPHAIMIEELWDTRENLRRHLRSDTYRLILLVIEMAESLPEIRFDSIIRSQGFELIEKERNRTENQE
jgi:quinol monooxygenase YgiN